VPSGNAIGSERRQCDEVRDGSLVIGEPGAVEIERGEPREGAESVGAREPAARDAQGPEVSAARLRPSAASVSSVMRDSCSPAGEHGADRIAGELVPAHPQALEPRGLAGR
jgi:hypothetical protein